MSKVEPQILFKVDVTKVTQLVDFRVAESLLGPMVANSCVEVHTSDGQQGTLTHLGFGTDTQQFAEDLRNLIGETNVPTLLVGGDIRSPRSCQLMSGLLKHLEEQGFRLSTGSNDLGGVFSRRTVLFKDYVQVERSRSLLSNGPGQILNLLFPATSTK